MVKYMDRPTLVANGLFGSANALRRMASNARAQVVTTSGTPTPECRDRLLPMRDSFEVLRLWFQFGARRPEAAVASARNATRMLDALAMLDATCSQMASDCQWWSASAVEVLEGSTTLRDEVRAIEERILSALTTAESIVSAILDR